MCVSIKYRNYLSLFYSCCCHHSGKWPNLLLWQLAKIWKLASMHHWIPTAIIFKNKIFKIFFLCVKIFLIIFKNLPHLYLHLHLLLQLPHLYLHLHHEDCLVSSRFEAPTKSSIYPAGLDNLFLLILYNKGKNLFTHELCKRCQGIWEKLFQPDLSNFRGPE